MPRSGPARPTTTTPVETPVVLLVEPDDLLRWALTEVATDCGYKVVAVPDAADPALEPLRLVSILLAVCRATDPPDALTALRRRFPEAAVALMTDEANAAAEACLRREGVDRVFVKPFDLLLLGRYLRSGLAEQRIQTAPPGGRRRGRTVY